MTGPYTRRMRTGVAAFATVLSACSGDGGTASHVATRLAFQVQPISAVRDTAMLATVAVAVLDENDDLLTSAITSVTLALGANPGGATLSGTTTANAVAGIATFPGLKLSATGTGYTLVANAAGLTAATSGTFNVTLSLADVDGDGLSPQAGDCDDGDPTRRPGLADDPDAAFQDTNCDGIDGRIAGAVFVRANGTDGASCGTMASPCLTIARGITVAQGIDADLYLGPGQFVGSVQVVGGVSLFGGFSETWQRGTGAITEIVGSGTIGVAGAAGQDVAIYVQGGFVAPTVIADLRVRAADAVGLRANGAGKNSYGIVVRGATDSLTVTRVTVIAGNGAAGAAGSDGTDATSTAAPNGGDGGAGAEVSVDCDQSSRGAGGLAATNPLATSGVDAGSGRGGDGGTMDTSCGGIVPDRLARPGQGGAAAAVSQALVFGYGGTGGSGGDICGPTTAGGSGLVANGAAGTAGSATGSLADNGFWTGSPGGDGAIGANGTGGGGGGGAGGCDDGIDAYGAGGGGGGAGGVSAPAAGSGGTAGGGSFGIYLIDASPRISTVTITRGDGGTGGAGGVGGRGQSGGLGGAPGTNIGSAAAGRGGDGAHGGHGGGGAGGAGGWSIGILRTGTSAPTLTAITYQGGTAGAGGAGGASAPSAPLAERDGNAGANGTAGTLGTVVVR